MRHMYVSAWNMRYTHKCIFSRFLIEHFCLFSRFRWQYYRRYYKRKVRIFSNVFPSHVPSIAVLAVYVFVAMRSAEGASSFTLEMKVLQWDEGVEEYGSALLLVHPTEPFCIFSLCSSRHRLSPYLRVESNLFLQFFILPSLPPALSRPLLPFAPHFLWTHDSSCSFEHRANYFLSGSVES